MKQANNHWAVVVNTTIQAIRESEALLQQLLTETANRIAASLATTHVDPSVGHQAFILLESNKHKWLESFPIYILESCAEVEPFDLYGSNSGVLDVNTLFLGTELGVHVRSEVTEQVRQLECALEPALTRLHALISGARGYAEIRPEATPMRPECYAIALQKMVYASANSNAKICLYLLKELIAGLTPLLGSSYQTAISMLSDADVHAAKPTSRPAQLNTTAPVHELQALAEPMPALLTRAILQDALRQALANSAPTADSRSLAQVANRRHVGNLDNAPKADHRISEPAAHAPQTDPAPPQTAPSFAQIIAQLGRLTAATPLLKERVAKLTPALRVLAQNDPSFLLNPHHPVRKILVKVERQAGKLTHSPEEMLRALYKFATRRATKTPLRNAATVHFLKQAMRAFEPADRRKAPAKAIKAPPVAVDTPASAPDGEAPTMNAAQYGVQLYAHIQQLPGFSRSPPRLQKFVSEPWLMVIVKTYYTPWCALPLHSRDPQHITQFDPHHYLQAISALITSAQAEAWRNASEPQREAVNGCWSIVQEGLTRMKLAPHKVQSAIEKLRKMHFAALAEAKALDAAEAAQSMPSLRASDPEGAQPDTPPAALASAPTVAAPPPATATAAQTADADADADAHNPPTAWQDSAANANADTNAEAALAPLEHILHLNQQFGIGQGETRVQSQLVWMSKDHTIFMFTSKNGSSQTMTRRRLQQLYTAGSFRPIP